MGWGGVTHGSLVERREQLHQNHAPVSSCCRVCVPTVVFPVVSFPCFCFCLFPFFFFLCVFVACAVCGVVCVESSRVGAVLASSGVPPPCETVFKTFF